MSRALSPYSNRHRFSAEGFQPLTKSNSDERSNMNTYSNRPGDVTIDIPLTNVQSNKSTGARKANAFSPVLSSAGDPMNEKLGLTKSYSHRHQDSIGFRGRRKRLEERGLNNKDSADGSRNFLGKIYDSIYHFSIITRYFLFVAPLAACIAVPIVIGATAAPNARIGTVQIVWFFTWIEVVWISLWVSKLFAKFLPYLFQFAIGVVSSGSRKYSTVITALEIPLSLVFWAIVSLTTFVPLMTLNPDARAHGRTGQTKWMTVVTKVLAACLFSTIVLLIEKVIIQLISISYHRKQFDGKIQDSKRNIYLTGLLYDASRTLFPTYCHEFAEEDYIIADNLDLGLGSRGMKSHARSGSATPMRLIHNAARIGDRVTAAVGNVASEITGKQVFNPTSAHSVVVEALEKKKTSEALARRIWLSFVLEGRDALYLEDIKDVLGAEHDDEAEEAFIALDADGNGDISLDEMILRVAEFGRERNTLANSMRDVDQAINVLDNLLLTVVLIVVAFIFVAWLNTSFVSTLATTGTALLSLSFVFAATCQEVLGSCIFLFVKHPYDVGDRVDIADKQYVVERISLLYTVFRCVNNHRKTQVANIVLNTVWIDNVSRSKAMRERINLYISFDTTMEDVELLRQELQKFVLDKDNARDFQPDFSIDVTGIAEMNKLELMVEVRHKSNWANEAVRAARRSKFMCALVLALKKVPIYAPGGGTAAAGDKANPTYSVAISDSDAQENKDKYAEDKEAARMVPTKSATNNEANATGIDFLGSSDVEARERAQVMGHTGLTHRSPSSVVQPPQATAVEEALDRQRSEDVEEVRNLLRKGSVSQGRRKAFQHDALSPSSSNIAAESGLIPAQTEPMATGAVAGLSPYRMPSIPSHATARLASREQTSPSTRMNFHEEEEELSHSQSQASAPPQIHLPPPASNPYGQLPSQAPPGYLQGQYRSRSASQSQSQNQSSSRGAPYGHI